MLSYLCNISGVSRSGYYKHFSNVTVQKRKSNEVRDLESRERAQKSYNLLTDESSVKVIAKKLFSYRTM